MGELFFIEKKENLPISEYAYIIKIKNFYFVISAEKYANEMAFVNDYRGIGKGPNMKTRFISHEGTLYICYSTIKTIYPKEELLVDYGEKYWSYFKSL